MGYTTDSSMHLLLCEICGDARASISNIKPNKKIAVWTFGMCHFVSLAHAHINKHFEHTESSAHHVPAYFCSNIMFTMNVVRQDWMSHLNLFPPLHYLITFHIPPLIAISVAVRSVLLKIKNVCIWKENYWVGWNSEFECFMKTEFKLF